MSFETSADTLTVPLSHHDCESSNPSTRRLSQTITDIVIGGNPTRSRSSSSPRPISPVKTEPNISKMSIHFDGGAQIIIRPNRIIRGNVILKNTRPIQASQIRVKFRAEEVATAKIKEYGLESKLERIDQMTTIYFDVDTKVWGSEPSAYLMNPWEEIEPGEHKYPFALKFPNVNFPPSTDDPAGFHIHYIWSAHLDGPAFNQGLRSKDHILPYRPIICAPPPAEWTFSQPISSDKKTVLANVSATLPKQAFCPDEKVDMALDVETLSSDYIVSHVTFALVKSSWGQIQLQRGTARKSKSKKILLATVAVPGNDGSVRIPVKFQIPTRLVSPSFQSQNLRVHYEIVFTIQFQSHGLLKSSHTVDFTVPIGITNLPYNHLLHIPNLTSVQSYLHSKEPPVFFDPFLDEPPSQTGIPSELWGPLTAALTTPPTTSPPNYFSLPNLPSQFIQKDREQKTIFTSRLIKPGMAQEIGDPLTIVSEHKDYSW